MLSEGDLVRWHEGYSERQARWLDMLADGFQLAPAFLEGIREQQRKVKSIMAHGVTTVTEATPARAVAHLMHTKNIKRVPVLRDGKLVGILARSDLVRALAQKLEEMDSAQPAQFKTLNEAPAARTPRELNGRTPSPAWLSQRQQAPALQAAAGA